ncbi:MAG: phage tail protein [Bacteroidales bacterium]|nr:phage tail protein [Bacteroidales bacterium]
MGNLIIYHSDGEPLQVRATITKAQQSVKLLGEDVISVEVGAKEVVPFAIGDYIEWCGKTYTLNQLPSVQKNTSVDFNYPSVTFEGEQYELLDSAWLLPSNTYGDSFTGDLQDFLSILIENTQRSGRTWQLGTYPTKSEYKTLTYSETNCLNVLQNLCQEYKVEFEIKRQGATRILNIKDKIGEEFPTRFEYGRTGGAYHIERNTVSNQNIITRLFVFGGDKNIPSTYRNPKLCLPGKTKNQSYISDAQSVATYGIRENVKTFPDIYPTRYGKVTGVTASDKKIFYDNTMDFDLNERDENGTKWLIPSSVAKIQFNSGGLAGYSFELSEYNHSTHRFKIKSYTDANGLQFPNPDSAAFQIRVGDEYFITDIRLPQSYIDEAETKLKTEGEKYFEENCKTHVNYAISISPLFLKHLYGDTKQTYEIFKAGDTVEIYDFDLEILKKLRISGFTRNLLNPYEFTLTIAENVEVQTSFQRIVRELTDIKSVIYTNDITAADNARRNWIATQELEKSVFDPEGHYYSEKIKPLSIETQMLATGARSQQFILKDVNFEPNYKGNPNLISNTAGQLEHFTIADPEVRVWNIRSGQGTTLEACNHSDGEGHTHIHGATVNDTIFHIYAKCSRSSDNGFIFYDCAEHTVESDPQYYHFLIGTLTSVITDNFDGVSRPARNIALTYGSSTINGRFIKTGRIQSADGSTFIDLDANLIGGRFLFKNGLISSAILVGQSEETATAGIGGNYLLWAGQLLRSSKNAGKYMFTLSHDGELIMRTWDGREFVKITPDTSNSRGFYKIGNIEGDIYSTEVHGTFQVSSTARFFSDINCDKNINAHNLYLGGVRLQYKLQSILIAFGKFSNNSIVEYGGFYHMTYNSNDEPIRTKNSPSLTHPQKGVYKITYPYDYEIPNLEKYYCFANVTDCAVDSQFYVAANINTNNIIFQIADDSSLNDLGDAVVQFCVFDFKQLFRI